MQVNMRFVSCTDESCPLNSQRQCRGPYIMLGENGECVTRIEGPHDNKSETEDYVEIRECCNTRCIHWQQDEESEIGVCGLADDLKIVKVVLQGPDGQELFERDESGKTVPKVSTVCMIYNNQIQQPDYTSRL